MNADMLKRILCIQYMTSYNTYIHVFINLFYILNIILLGMLVTKMFMK